MRKKIKEIRLKKRLFKTRWQIYNIILFVEPRDIWVGVYWNMSCDWILDIYVCILPFLPIRFNFMKSHETYYEDMEQEKVDDNR